MKKLYFENLDGARFLSFFMVFLYHSFYTEIPEIKESKIYKLFTETLFDNGNLGVNFFFVLSGFLITYLLIDERVKFNKINIGYFYARRILRIWPVYFFCVFFGFFIFPQIKLLFGQTSNESASLVYYLTFINNFDFINKGLPDSSVLSVLWSIAVEEQFYFVWPLILVIFPLQKYWIPFLCLWLTSIIFRANFDTYLMHEFHTLSCISDMVIGAFAAWLIYFNNTFKNLITSLSKFKIGLIYLLLLIVFLFRQELFLENYVLRIFERSFIGIIFCLVILEQTYSVNSFFKFSNFPKFSNLGQISYGLYCYQFIGILIAIKITGILGLNKQLWQVIIIDTSLALSLTILISYISYRFYETPILRLKKHFTQSIAS